MKNQFECSHQTKGKFEKKIPNACDKFVDFKRDLFTRSREVHLKSRVHLLYSAQCPNWRNCSIGSTGYQSTVNTPTSAAHSSNKSVKIRLLLSSSAAYHWKEGLGSV